MEELTFESLFSFLWDSFHIQLFHAKWDWYPRRVWVLPFLCCQPPPGYLEAAFQFPLGEERLQLCFPLTAITLEKRQREQYSHYPYCPFSGLYMAFSLLDGTRTTFCVESWNNRGMEKCLLCCSSWADEAVSTCSPVLRAKCLRLTMKFHHDSRLMMKLTPKTILRRKIFKGLRSGWMI